jgi:hypothetical protein
MPDVTSNIFIDWSYLATQSGSRDTVQEYVAGNPDSIGEVNLLSNYTVVAGTNSILIYPVEIFTTSSGTTISGYLSTAVTLTLTSSGTMASGIMTCLVDYSTPFTISGTKTFIDTNFSYFRKDTKTSGIQYVPSEWIAGLDYRTFTSTPLAYKTVDYIDVLIDLETLYTAANYHDPSDPESHPVISGTLPVTTIFTLNDLDLGSVNALNDITFAGYVFKFKPYDLSYYIHVSTGDPVTSDAYNFESENVNGALDAILFNSICGVSGTQYGVYFEPSCGLELEPWIYFVSEAIDGRVRWNCFNQICGLERIGTGFGFDIDLFSLKILDLSLGIGDFSYADGTVCVDVVDDVYGVATSGTYFIVDGVVASGIFTSITDGYRMCYDPTDNFASLVGATELRVHATNNNGQVIEKAFYLTSGYIVEYDSQSDYGDVVTVKLTAEDFASCPALGGSAYWFQVSPRYTSDLGASIDVLPQEHTDLPATLTPDTQLVYFYSKIFRVELKVKDYAGNEMPPYVFEFRIEDKPD